MSVRLLLAVAAFGIFISTTGAFMTPQASAKGPAIADSTPGIRFEDTATEKSIIALDACARDMAGDGWSGHPYGKIGNFWEAKWCRGNGARDDCQIASSSSTRPDQQVIQIYSLFYPQSFPEMFGLGLSALYTPPDQGIGCLVYYAEKGKTVVGEGFSLQFTEFGKDGRKKENFVELRDYYRYQVHETWVELKSDDSLRDEFRKYILSAESMRDRGLERLKALLDKVETVIISHQGKGCDYGEYKGDGIPPECFIRPLTAQEEEEALARAQADIGGQIDFLTRNYKVMYDTMIKTFPLKDCFQ